MMQTQALPVLSSPVSVPAAPQCLPQGEKHKEKEPETLLSHVDICQNCLGRKTREELH